MIDARYPALPSLLLHTLAALGWQAISGACDGFGLLLGAFSDDGSRTALYLVDGAWAADAMGAGPTGPFLVTQGTAHVLQHGQLTGENDEVLYNGQRWRIQAIAENGYLIARAVPAA